MSTGSKMPLARAQKLAGRFMEKLHDSCMRAEVAGSVRRKVDMVGDIEIVCVANDELVLELLFPEGYPGMTVSGARLKRFIYPERQVQIELYITSPADWGRIFAIRTGSSAFSHMQLATQWNRIGWCGTSEGLRRKKECVKKSSWKILPEFKHNPILPPKFTTERKFFDFLGISWVDPINRSWTSRVRPELNYSR